MALTLSGLPVHRFTFLGYLPEKTMARNKLLESLQQSAKILPATYISFVAPHKLVNTLKDIETTLGDIDVVLTKELTKTFQQIIRLKVSEMLVHLAKGGIKGEFILLFYLD